ncbi:hypothetical protein DRO42_07275 [Candidatus Bathyarchaeota archaeon]|nr:MAG: hypothetical protein DRO42_07275 [Candidatus Bathyarchaeota archaeon]
MGGVLVRVVRRVSLGEVRRRVAELERKYGGGLDGLSDQFLGGQADRERFEDYVEWVGMVHALRAYGEGEDFDYYTEEELDLGRDEVSRLTPRRLELLDHLSRFRPRSINALASGMGRDVKNVYGDLKVLEGLGFVRLVREGRRVVPELLVQELTLLLG